MSAGGFAGKLKSLRDASGLSQVELAERAGMHRFGIAKLEQGVREPTWATVQTLAKALGVDCTAFADCEDVQADEQAPATRARKKAASVQGSTKKGRK